MSFDFEAFARALLAEVLFYDAEFGVAGYVSLIDPKVNRECYIAGYDPAEEVYVIEEATEWEAAGEEEDFGHVLAVDTKVYRECATNVEAAETVLALAGEHVLVPSFLPEFDVEA